jgi:DNA modification methylase
MIPDASVDLVYLDPPFNSNATYNVLFKPPEELGDAAQIKAFEDTWHWTVQTEREYSEILKNPYGNADLANLISALKQFLGVNDMMAYLVHMANRLLEIRRVMKDTASIYLHCDPTACHYLKLVMDAVFGACYFRNEVSWKRANAHNDPNRYGSITDLLLFYSKTNDYTWNTQYTDYREEYYKSHFKKDKNGRYYRTVPLDAPKHGEGSKNLIYEWKGKCPASTRTWAVIKEKMEQYDKEDRIVYTKTGTPTLLQYADEMPGVPLQNIWVDIPPVNPQARERLGYPTQKPQALLERIIKASSNEGDTVLDPFCGCGTTVHAAEELKRSWIGIDITHLAINLIRTRLTSAFPGIEIETHGLPASYAGALELARADKHEFELWVLGELDAMPYKGGRKGPDTGIDGYIFFRCLDGEKVRDGKAIVEVKGGGTTVKDVRNLDAVVEHEGADLGVLVSALKPTSKMREFAAGRGTVSLGTKEYPRLQVVWLKDLMENKARVEYPESGKIEHQKKAPRHRRDYQEEIGSES